MSRRTALLLLLSLAPAAWAGQPIQIGPAVPVCAAAPDARAQLFPAGASGGGQSVLVAWQQGRKYFQGEDPVVLAARVSVDGKPLDPKPLTLCEAAGSQERPRVAFARDLFLVVWQDFRSGKDWDVYGARVTPAGQVLDPRGIPIATGPHSQALPDVAGGPDGFLVVWQDRRNGQFYEPRAARVDAAGKVHPPGGAALSQGGTRLRGGSVHVGRTPDAWFLAWKDDFVWRRGGGQKSTVTRFVGRISLAGGAPSLLDARRIPLGLYGLHPACMAGGRTRVFLATGGSQRSVRCAMGALFDAATGEALANPNTETARGGSGWNTQRAIVLLEPLVPGYLPPMAVGASDDLFLVAIRQRARRRGARLPLRLLRIDREGNRLDPPAGLPILDPGKRPCSHPAVAGLPSGRFLVAYQSDGGPGRRRILARMVNTHPSPR